MHKILKGNQEEMILYGLFYASSNEKQVPDALQVIHDAQPKLFKKVVEKFSLKFRIKRVREP